MKRDDPMYEYISQIEKAEHDVANLFTAIFKNLGEEEARRIFAKVLAQPRGKKPNPENKNIDRFLSTLLELGLTKNDAAEVAYKYNLVHSIGAAKQRMKPSHKKAREK